MINLENRYPNFMEAMQTMKQGTDMRLHSSSVSKIEYIMTFQIFNNKLGDISLELNEVFSNEVSIIFTTIKNFKKQAQTKSKLVKNDLSVEGWIELISTTMIEHNSNTDHQKLLLDFSSKRLGINSHKESGCLSTVLSLVFLISLFFSLLIK